ncbi:MAG: ABC transporter ATP-binding protein [Thermoleophilia bacterium]|jgi:iron complex transport system ATP-binding protein
MSEQYYFYTDQLAVGYDGKPLIKNIKMQLNAGEILTLIGPNGSGKTTILKTITKYLKSIYGTVYIDNRSIEDMTNKDMSHEVAVVLTERLRTELMTCEDVVATGRYPYTGRLGILSEHDKRQTREAMELVDTWDLRDRDFTRISDGQRQRVLLARAICQEPQIIVLDEPTSFLDIRYQLELLDILRSMAKLRGIAVVMSMHELDLAQKISDVVMCVRGEFIEHYGSPKDIFKRELIHALYDLVDGSYNPLFGSVELGRPQGEARVFVIAGGGTGIEEYRALQKQGVPFVTGILHENDIDFQLAAELATEVISEPGFTTIRDETLQVAIARLESCDAVINCLQDYGETNVKNRVLYEKAVAMGLKTWRHADDLLAEERGS